MVVLFFRLPRRLDRFPRRNECLLFSPLPLSPPFQPASVYMHWRLSWGKGGREGGRGGGLPQVSGCKGIVIRSKKYRGPTFMIVVQHACMHVCVCVCVGVCVSVCLCVYVYTLYP